MRIRQLFLKIVLVVFCSFAASSANAQLAFNLTTGNNSTSLQKVVIDSNKCPNQGPVAAYTGGLITNNGVTTANNVSVALTGLSGGFFLAGGQPSSQFVGAIAPGQSVALYWLTGYGCVDQTNSNATIIMSSSLITTSRTYSLRTQQSKSANAGGQVTGSTLGPGAVVGQIILLDVTYDFGGNDVGHEFFLQPAGSTSFNAGCFRMIKTEVRSSNINGIVVGQTNKLYFVQPSQQPGNNYNATIRYSFQYLCAGASTVARPYAAQTSGTQLKYTGNFDGAGSIQITYPGATNPFTITKTASPDKLTKGGPTAVTYTVTISNPSVFGSYISSIVDVLPTGATFGAIATGSDVTAANSSSIPANGAAGTLTFQSQYGQTYFIAGGGSVALKYTADIPATVGTYTNTAQAQFGTAVTPVASSTVTVSEPSLSVTKVSAVYSDPVNGTSNPFSIPGATTEYTIAVTNPNSIALDAESVIVSDKLPTNMRMVVTDFSGAGTGPIGYTDTSAGLSYVFSGMGDLLDDLSFSDDNGLTWIYVPADSGDGTDGNITNFRVQPSGTMGAGDGFELKLRGVID